MSSPSATALPTPAEFERQLTHFINATLLKGEGGVGPDTRLFEEGYINSLRILDLIAFVEKALSRRIPDRAVRLANFRTVATIVRAFHPDAAVAETAVEPSPVRFEHRTTRAAFASPVDALVQRGDLAVTGAGQVTLSGVALEVFRAVDRAVAGWAAVLGATERAFPSLIDSRVLERAGQLESFPQHVTIAAHLEPNGQTASENGVRHALAPAVCYHSYPEWEGKTVGEAPTLLTAVGRCYRYEGGHHVPLERLWEFSMREIIVLGSRDQVEHVRQALVERVSSLVATLSFDGAIEPATDPFFTSGDEGRRLMQQAGALKYELQLTVDASGRSVAVASFNHHHDYFGQRFAIRLPNGAAAHSGCVAFGLERWVLALFAQHGADEARWPDAARRWIDDGRSVGRGPADERGRT